MPTAPTPASLYRKSRRDYWRQRIAEDMAAKGITDWTVTFDRRGLPKTITSKAPHG